MWLLFLPLCLEFRVHASKAFYNVVGFLYQIVLICPTTYISKAGFFLILRLVQVQDLHGPQEDILSLFKIEMTLVKVIYTV